MMRSGARTERWNAGNQGSNEDLLGARRYTRRAACSPEKGQRRGNSAVVADGFEHKGLGTDDLRVCEASVRHGAAALDQAARQKENRARALFAHCTEGQAKQTFWSAAAA